MKINIKVEYVLTKQDEKMVLKFLEGKITCRELGNYMGCSHQSAINRVCAICRQWVQNKKIKVV